MKNAETAAPLFQLRIKADLLRKIRDRAKRERRSMSEFMRHAAELELQRKVRA
jgi:hypothetical protein